MAERQRLLYAVLSGPPAFVRAFDLDTLTPIGDGVTLRNGRGVALVDERDGDLVVATGDDTGNARLERVGVVNGVLAARGHVDLAVVLPGRKVLGMTWGHTPDWIYVASGVGGYLGDGTIAITQVGARAMAAGDASVGWTHPLPGCQGFVYSAARTHGAIGFVPQTNSLLFGCRTTMTPFQHPPLPAGAATLSLTQHGTGAPQPGTFELFRYPMDFNPAAPGSQFDVQSGRLVMIGTESTAAQYALVFDGRRETYVGKVALASDGINGLGLDQVGGRLYGLSGGRSLKTADIRATPVGQGLVFTEPAPEAAGLPDIAPITVDGTTRRLFVAHASMPYFVVLRDHVPAYSPPPPANPDAGTINVPEQPGVTGASYSGEGQGYGARARLVGGTGALQLNLTRLDATPIQRPGTRDLRSAWLDRLSLTNEESSTAGITADRDQEQTAHDERDIEDLIRRLENGEVIEEEDDGEEEDPAEEEGEETEVWPYRPAACRDFGGDPATVTEEGATAHCDLAKRVSEFSAANGFGAEAVTVQRASVHGTSTIDPERGLVTTVESSAEGVSLLNGAVTIGKVWAKATATARGRPGTAKGGMERELYNVVVNGRPLCGGKPGQPCSIEAVQQAVNSVVGGTMRVEFPEPDAEMAKGTPGGYRAIVRRSVAKQWEAVVLDGERENFLAVPGMRVTVYHDNYTAGRLVLDLAGVEAESNYGIYLLGPGGDSPPEPPAPEFPTAEPPADDGLDPVIEAALPPNDARPAPVTGQGPISRIVEDIPGARLLLNGLRLFGPMFAMWGLLLVPVYLSARRWELFHRASLLQERDT